jgi:hypothetical protein
MDVYSTASLIAMVASLHRRHAFMLDVFFGQIVPPTGQREIYFDVENDILSVAPFVSPLKEGKPVTERGFQTKSFTPAYIKPFMALDPLAPVTRSINEPLLGNLTPQQREEARVARGLNDLIDITFRRLELMAIDAIDDGVNTVTGEGYDAVAVNYGRASAHTKALTSTARWGESGVSPVDDLDDWLQLVATATGVQPDRVVMDPLAWKLYSADAKFKERRDSTLLVLPGEGTQGTPGLSTGSIGGKRKAVLDSQVEIWVYQQQYKNDAGSTVNMIPDYSVYIGTSDPRCQGVRHFGTILDPELGYSAEQLVDPESGAIMWFAPKSWTTPNPAQRFLMVQCAPLTALTRPNATLRARVR